MDSIPKITKIPATVPMFRQADFSSETKRRVAAYARVSTDSDEQETSFDAQVDYYTKYIAERKDWTLVGVYTDEGISAVNTKRREGFKRMISDALNGQIDLIVTKSVSRFARNTVDSLETIRRLKDKKVECYFEKEGIWTFDGKGELLITIMSSLAQEESRSISENVTWGQRKRFADGKVSMPYKQFLGYEKGADGKPQIVESEAKTVRQIYSMYLYGSSVREIARSLTAQGIPTPGGKTNWSVTTILSVLQNEKYAGNAILQKTYCEDFLTKRVVKNQGQVPQYYVEQSHPAIVTQEVFDMVQVELTKNRERGISRSGGSSCFSGRVFCGSCGATYGRKVWDSNTPYRHEVWQCNGKYKGRGGAKCFTPHLTEEQLQKAFVTAFNSILSDCESYIADLTPAIELLGDTTVLDRQIEVFTERSAGIYTQLEAMIGDNAHIKQDQGDFKSRYNELRAHYDAVKMQLEKAEFEKQSTLIKKEKAEQFIEVLCGRDTLISKFDEALFRATVESITVHSEKDVRVKFRDGQEISTDVRLKVYRESNLA